MRVLIVEDDATTASVLERALREEGNAVVTERNGLRAVELARSAAFDAIVLDVMLPGLDGFEVVHRLRQQGCQTPVLMLTAKTANRDLIYGLNVGADDYLTKPFELDVFFARLRAVGRRGNTRLALIFKVGSLTLNTATRGVARGGREIQLTRTEFGILELLVKSAGRVLTREQIIEAIWGFDSEVGRTNLDAFLHLLRSKVDAPGEPKLLHTVRGVGYTAREGKPT